jgi:hypothetical protein
VTEVALPPPPVEPAVAKPQGRTRVLHALSSDWGLRVLALVLALLLWSVVRQTISVEAYIYVDILPRPYSPAQFEAYAVVRDRIPVKLRGPQGEIDAARASLGNPATIEVRARDLQPGLDYEFITERWAQTNERIIVGSHRRLFVEMPDVSMHVYRKVRQRATIAVPVWGNLPKGYVAKDVRIAPAEVVVEAAAGALGEYLEPDLIDVTEHFRDDPSKPVTRPLFFNQWKKGGGVAEKAVVRERIALPEATVTVRFEAVTTATIPGPITMYYAGTSQGDRASDYEWAVDAAGVPGLDLEPGQSQGRFQGTFRGAEADLQVLEDRRGEWGYVYRIPVADMEEFRKNAEEKTRPVRAALGWAPSSDELRRLPVTFVPPPSFSEVTVTVTKKQ